jgi:hypothetical protein
MPGLVLIRVWDPAPDAGAPRASGRKEFRGIGVEVWLVRAHAVRRLAQFPEPGTEIPHVRVHPSAQGRHRYPTISPDSSRSTTQRRRSTRSPHSAHSTSRFAISRHTTHPALHRAGIPTDSLPGEATADQSSQTTQSSWPSAVNSASVWMSSTVGGPKKKTQTHFPDFVTKSAATSGSDFPAIGQAHGPVETTAATTVTSRIAAYTARSFRNCSRSHEYHRSASWRRLTRRDLSMRTIYITTTPRSNT